jgi:hypothetical protein
VAAEGEEEVMLLYRKPSTRATRMRKDVADHSASAVVIAPASSSSSSVAQSMTSLSPEQLVLVFFKRAAGPVNLPRYLSYCGVKDVQLRGGTGEAYQLTQQQIFQCSNDRLETAVRALSNLTALIFTPADTSAAAGTPWVGQMCWVLPAHQPVAVALARVCEAAVPLQLPPLLDSNVVAHMEKSKGSSDAMLWACPVELVGAPKGFVVPTASSVDSDLAKDLPEVPDAERQATSTRTSPSSSAAGTSVKKIELAPSPVSLRAVQQRQRCLHRLHQLRLAYGGLLPRLHAAHTLDELCHLVFSHDVDTCQTLGRLLHVRVFAETASLPTPTAFDALSHPTVMRTGSGRTSTPARAKNLVDDLSSFLGNPLQLDTLLPLVGTSARHPQEEALLQHLVNLLKVATAVDATTWGPMAAMASWRCTDGVYVVHHASRVRALRRVVAEANFYGLPRFLRSIRAATTGGGGGGDGCWMQPTALLRAQSRYTDQFYLTPDALDPASFIQPDPMQVQLVQEELITLQRTHGVFCLVVGEADEVVCLLRDHLACVGRSWQHLTKKEEDGGGAVKAEPSTGDDDEAAEGGGAVKDGGGGGQVDPASRSSVGIQRTAQFIDPLHHYVLRTIEAARQHECEMKRLRRAPLPGQCPTESAPAAAAPLPFSHVQWVDGGSTNRWSPNTYYYGLVYMVVLETDEWETEEVSLATEGLLPATAIHISEDASTETLRPPRPPTYYVNAMLELWRS